MFFPSQEYIHLVQPSSKTSVSKEQQYTIKIAGIRQFNDISGKQLGINILKANGDCRRGNNYSVATSAPPQLGKCLCKSLLWPEGVTFPPSFAALSGRGRAGVGLRCPAVFGPSDSRAQLPPAPGCPQRRATHRLHTDGPLTAKAKWHSHCKRAHRFRFW